MTLLVVLVSPFDTCFLCQAIAADASLWKSISSSTHSVDDELTLAKRPILTRGPSVYQGAEEKVIAEVWFSMIYFDTVQWHIPSSLSLSLSLAF